MLQSRAVIRIDHRDAVVLQLAGDTWTSKTIHTHSDQTHPHRGDRSDRAYFSDVCDALVGIKEILVTGPHTAQSDFRNYVQSHRPSVGDRIVDWETVDHPTEGELAAVARSYFQRRDSLAGTSARR